MRNHYADKLGSLSSTFNFTCHGLSAKSSQLVMMRGKVNRDMADVCQYNGLDVGYATNYEILSSFFIANRLTATFFNNNYTWGFWDEEAGQWRGAVAMVRKNTDTIIISFFFFFCHTHFFS
jgi:hypothetical protein